MTGTFSSFNTALSAIRHQRTVMDIASTNIANVDTPGYVRRRAEAASLGGATEIAMWSRDTSAGHGVRTAGITRMSEPLLDARSRREHGRSAYLETRVDVLKRVESGMGEPGDSGVANALDDFNKAWDDLGNHTQVGGASRQQILATGQALADAIRAQATNVTSEQADQRGAALDLVTEVNTVAKDLASVNERLAQAASFGLDDNDLRDQRDVLALKLSELTGGVTSTRTDGGLDVTIGGEPLVSGSTAAQFSVTGGIAADGSDDGNPLAFAVGGNPVAVGAVGGELGAVGEVLSTSLPNLLAQLDGVAKTLADTVNAQHALGYDAAGAAGTPFFSYDPALGVANSLQVAITDPKLVAAAATATPGGNEDGNNAGKLSELTAGGEAYKRMVNGLATDITSSTRLAQTQKLLTTQVDGAREALTGVNYDEETVNLVAAQRGYEAAARVMSTMDQVLDTLINRMAI
jgi:flagellar hook-associated protein 1 FlgK